MAIYLTVYKPQYFPSNIISFPSLILRTPLGYEPGVVTLLLIESNDLDDLLSPTPTTLIIARQTPLHHLPLSDTRGAH